MHQRNGNMTRDLQLLADALQSVERVPDNVAANRRHIVARELRSLLVVGEANRYGVDGSRFLAMLEQRRPLAFDSDQQFRDFVSDLQGVLAACRVRGNIRLIGTSTSLFSLNPEKTFPHYFDCDSHAHSDLDVGLECPLLAELMDAHGIRPKPSRLNVHGTFSRHDLAVVIPEFGTLLDRWETSLHCPDGSRRNIGIGAPADGAPTMLGWITDYVLPIPGSSHSLFQ